MRDFMRRAPRMQGGARGRAHGGVGVRSVKAYAATRKQRADVRDAGRGLRTGKEGLANCACLRGARGGGCLQTHVGAQQAAVKGLGKEKEEGWLGGEGSCEGGKGENDKFEDPFLHRLRLYYGVLERGRGEGVYDLDLS